MTLTLTVNLRGFKMTKEIMQQVMIRMPAALVQKIEELAVAESRSRSNMIRVLIEKGIKHGKAKK